MPKASPILVMPAVKLNSLPQHEREIVSRFLFQHIRGLDDKHNRRWRRLWRQGWHAEPGEVMHIEVIRGRSLRFHKRWMAIETRLFESQERFTNIDKLRNWIKVGAEFGVYERDYRGRLHFTPASIAFDACSDDVMREFVEMATAHLRTPHAQRYLWPHIKAPARAEMLEIILREGETA